MVVIEVMAGLANRMFQIAFAKNLENKGVSVEIDDTYIANKWKFEDVNIQDVFPNVKFNSVSQQVINKLGGGNDIISKIRRKIPLLRNKHYLLVKVFDGFNPNIFSLKGDFYLSGNWMSEKYFFDSVEMIKESFKFKEFEDNRNILLQKEMQSCESVAIHVRKGADYNNSVNAEVCGIDYYNGAINYIKDNISNPIFYVFSDNKEWVRENFTDFNYQLVDWNPTAGNQNYLDMQLMSSAKHNIIANSTYSWWGAWLNNNKNKICILPLIWFNPHIVKKTSIELDIAPQNWIAL